jgi:two-component system sensor histidine kinase MtrB
VRFGLGLLRRRRLRVRFFLAFVGLTTLVTAVLALATFFFVGTLLERQRIEAATRQTGFAALFAREFLAARAGRERELVQHLQTRQPLDAITVSNGASFSTSLALTAAAVPSGLRGLVDDGRVGYQIEFVDGTRTLVFGVPLAGGPDLFLFYSLADVDRTMSILGRVLVVTGMIIVILGILVARQLTRRVLHPLTAVTGAATKVAEGLLDTRVEAASDDEVGILAVSFNRMAEAVAERVERERRFVAAVSHELRTPLAGLQATSELLRSHRQEVSPTGREAVDLIVEDVANLRRLVEELMEVSELDAGAAKVRSEEVDLRAVVAAQAEKDRRRVPVDGPSVVTYSDKARIARIVSNLLDNAFDHGTGEGVAVDVVNEGDCCTIAVRDRGPGIDPADAERIFAPFYKADRSRTRERGGVGLGLAIALANARLLGGTIEVVSRPEEGSTFTLRLPRRSAPEPAT